MIEQLYSDFTNNLLPKIQQGLVITKDYFLELFGRYQQYLITINSIGVAVGIILSIVGFICLSKWIKFGKECDWDGYNHESIVWFGFLIAIILFAGFMTFGMNLNYLIKDIYIPEIRMLEIIKSLN